MGVATTAVDAFTALPYLAAAAIVTGQGLSVPVQVLVLVAYTVVHLLPVLGVLVLRLVLGRRLDPVLGAAFAFLGRWGGPAAGVLAVAAGLALAVLGVRALAG